MDAQQPAGLGQCVRAAVGVQQAGAFAQQHHAHGQALYHRQRCMRQGLGAVQAPVQRKRRLQVRHQRLQSKLLVGRVGATALAAHGRDVEGAVAALFDHRRQCVEQVERTQPVAMPFGARQIFIRIELGPIDDAALVVHALVLRPDIGAAVVGREAGHGLFVHPMVGCERGNPARHLHRPVREILPKDHRGL